MNKKAFTLHRRGSAGFTMIEIIIVIVVTSLIAVVAATVINNGMGVWFLLRDQSNLMLETKATMKRMVREIRRTENSADGIITFTATEYQFDDINNNRIRYWQDGTDLKRGTRVLLPDLASSGGLEFVYYDSSGNVATLDENVRSVQISIAVVSGNNRVRLRNIANLRNR